MLLFHLYFTTFIETKDVNERKCYSCSLESYTEACDNEAHCMPNESKCVTIEMGNSQNITILKKCGFEGLEDIPEGCLCLDSGQFLCFATCSDDLCNDSEISYPGFDPASCWNTDTTTIYTDTTDTITTPSYNTTISSEDSKTLRYDLVFGITIPLLFLLSVCLMCLVHQKINHNP